MCVCTCVGGGGAHLLVAVVAFEVAHVFCDANLRHLHCVEEVEALHYIHKRNLLRRGHRQSAIDLAYTHRKSTTVKVQP